MNTLGPKVGPMLLVRLVFGFFVIGALIKGLIFLQGGGAQPRLAHISGGICLVIASLVVMVLTARAWAGAFFAMCLYGVVKVILSLLAGETTSSGHVRTPVPEAYEVLVLLGVFGWLTFPYTSREPTIYEALALTASVVAMLPIVSIKSTLVALTISLVVLCIARYLRRFPSFQRPLPTLSFKRKLQREPGQAWQQLAHLVIKARTFLRFLSAH
jgi:hypothetical protein